MAPGLALCEAIRHQGLGHGISRKLWKGGSQKGVGEVRPRLFMTATGGGGVCVRAATGSGHGFLGTREPSGSCPCPFLAWVLQQLTEPAKWS